MSVLPPAIRVVNTAALVAKVLPQMAQWSTLPCCSCLFSTAHPYNEIASLQQFALTQHSGRACRCSSCTGKRWENELVSVFLKQQSVRWHWYICIICLSNYILGHPALTFCLTHSQVTCVFSLVCSLTQDVDDVQMSAEKQISAHVFPDLCLTHQLPWQVICTVSHQKFFGFFFPVCSRVTAPHYSYWFEIHWGRKCFS